MTKPAYIGTWQLIPELCFYEAGPGLEWACYEITVTDGRVHFLIEWKKRGARQAIEFGGPLDGRLHPSSTPHGSEMSYTHVDERTLESAVFAAGVRLAFARRQVSRDGALMSVLQINTSDDGAETRIMQIYRRIA